ncbi:hypothetical protein BX070DRAFT_238267 [Coemansia spiralis]|nr:hypothetical protein BX070DRAFT_238267 [Coemansia spiralis]
MSRRDKDRKRAAEIQDKAESKANKNEPNGPSKKRTKETKLVDSRTLDHIPCAKMYERSYMHRDTVSHVVMTKTGFIITISVDGHIKFWKKREKGIEFVKDFRAHLGPISAYAVSTDGHLFATTSADKTVKVFDVLNFDMISIIDTDIVSLSICWIKDPLDQSTCIVVADSNLPVAYIYDPYSGNTPKRTITNVHRQPILLMGYNPAVECIVSIDKGGMIEYWALDEPHELPQSVNFQLKTQTDLYEFKKAKCVPNSLTFSPNFELFSCTCMTDSTVRVFKFSTGKLYRKYDESISASNTIQQGDENGRFKLDEMEFGRRLATENEIRKSSEGKGINAVFDNNSRFLFLASLFGIKVVDLSTNKVVRILGKSEPRRFLNIGLCQTLPNSYTARLDLVTSSNSGAKKDAGEDPTLFCTAYKSNRFYMFTREEPDYSAQDNTRDIFNEKPTREEASLAIAPAKQKPVRSAVLRTTLGDIHLSLFPEYAPKAVENFAVHSRNGYYNGVIFHRVIKRFMIQTGDPLGDGTGGESIWGKPFEDEFTPNLRHDHPYMLSMANAGPQTNGSQFFITTIESAPWLDDKHTIFGRVTSGTDIVHLIEAAKTDKRDKPLEDISVLNIQIQHDNSQ